VYNGNKYRVLKGKRRLQMKKVLFIFLTILMFLSCAMKSDNQKNNENPENEISENKNSSVQQVPENNSFQKSDIIQDTNNGRFGNEKVGFINYPKGNWNEIQNNTDSTSAGIKNDENEMIILDKVPSEEGVNAGKAATQMISELVNQGQKKENLKLYKNSINGHQAYLIFSETVNNNNLQASMIFIDAENEVYYVAVIAKPNNITKLLEIVTSSWNIR